MHGVAPNKQNTDKIRRLLFIKILLCFSTFGYPQLAYRILVVLLWCLLVSEIMHGGAPEVYLY